MILQKNIKFTKAFNEHSIIKKYLAIVHGKIIGTGEYIDYIKKEAEYQNH